MSTNSSLSLVRDSVNATNQAMFGTAPSGAPTGLGTSSLSASDHSSAKAVQSIGQTTAIVVQDAADMLRNVNTIETTAIGAATAALLATKDVKYAEIIAGSLATMFIVAELYEFIGSNAAKVLKKFD